MYTLTECKTYFGIERMNILMNLEFIIPKDVISLITLYDLNFILKEKKMIHQQKNYCHFLYYEHNIYSILNKEEQNPGFSLLFNIDTNASRFLTLKNMIHDGWHQRSEKYREYEKFSSFDIYNDHYIEFPSCWVINNCRIARPVREEAVIFKRNLKLFTGKSDFLYWSEFLPSGVKQYDWKKVQINQDLPGWTSWSMFSDQIFIMIKLGVIYLYNLDTSSSLLSPFLSIQLENLYSDTSILVTKQLIHILIKCKEYEKKDEENFKHYELDLLNFKVQKKC